MGHVAGYIAIAATVARVRATRSAGQLDLQPAAAGADEDRLPGERGLVDGRLQLLALTERVTLADRSTAERATGYVIGGISPLGQRKQLPATVDESALDWETILVSAGRRGLQIELSPSDLVALTGATVAAIAK